MKKIGCVIAVLMGFGAAMASAQNYDESKIPPYTLEDPLVFANGKKVKSSKQWAQRREEILEIFQSEMYGRKPADPETVVTQILEQGPTLAGFATRKQVRMWFKADKSGPSIDWLIVTPNHIKGPVPTVMLLNYGGNFTVLPENEVLLPEDYSIWDGGIDPRKRGSMIGPNSPTIIPVNMLVAKGYALVTACYENISPDPDPATPEEQDEFAYTRIFELWGERDPHRTDNTTSLMAWAWGLMRGMDMIEQDPGLDETRVVLTGYSRLGKAALIAGAFDDRFPIVVPNQTGGGGAPLAKRYFGENVRTETTKFTHWYCKAYKKYADNESAMKFDQHLLLACVAPRSLLIEGFDQPWFDTKGEFLSVQAASPVWEFLGKKGLPDVSWPDDYETTAIGSNLGYVRRDLKHGISAIDWVWMLDFAERSFGIMKR